MVYRQTIVKRPLEYAEGLAQARRAQVGYTENGVDIWAREGKPVPHRRFLLSRGDLVRYEHPLTVSGRAAFRRSIGLDG